MRWSNPPGIMSTDLDYTKHSSAIDCTRGIQNNQKTVSGKIGERTTNLFFVGCVLAFVRWRLFTPVHLNKGVMRGATFLPVSPHFLADKGIRIFTPNVATRADLAPSRQHLFHFHLRHLSLSEKVTQSVFDIIHQLLQITKTTDLLCAKSRCNWLDKHERARLISDPCVIVFCFPGFKTDNSKLSINLIPSEGFDFIQAPSLLICNGHKISKVFR